MAITKRDLQAEVDKLNKKYCARTGNELRIQGAYGGYREREIMKNSVCTTTALGRKDCVKFHDKNGNTATYRYGRGWVN